MIVCWEVSVGRWGVVLMVSNRPNFFFIFWVAFGLDRIVKFLLEL